MIDALFSFRGRINRLQYFLRAFAVFIATVVLIVAAFFTFGGERTLLRPSLGLGFCVLLLLLGYLWASFSLQARRFRDIGWNPLYVVPAWLTFDVVMRFVALRQPVVGLLAALVNLGLGGCLLFWPGKADDVPAAPAASVGWTTAPRPAPAPGYARAPAVAARSGFGRRGV